MAEQHERFINTVQLSGYIRNLNKKESRSGDGSTIVNFALCQERPLPGRDIINTYPYHCFARWELADRIWNLIPEDLKVTVRASVHDMEQGPYQGDPRNVAFRVTEVQISLMSEVFESFENVQRAEDTPTKRRSIEDLLDEEIG